MAQIITKTKQKYDLRNNKYGRIIINSEPPRLEGDKCSITFYDSVQLEYITTPPEGEPITGVAEQAITQPRAITITQLQYSQLLGAAKQMVKSYHPELAVPEKQLQFDAAAQAYSLLIYVTTDILKNEDGSSTGKTIWGLEPTDWEVKL